MPTPLTLHHTQPCRLLLARRKLRHLAELDYTQQQPQQRGGMRGVAGLQQDQVVMRVKEEPHATSVTR